MCCIVFMEVKDVLFVRCWQCGVKFVNVKWNLSKDFQLLLWEVKSYQRRWKPNQLQYRDLLRLQEREIKLRKIGICLLFTMCCTGRHWIIASELLCLASSGWNLLPWRDWTFDDKTSYAGVITKGNKTEEKSIIFKKKSVLCSIHNQTLQLFCCVIIWRFQLT